MATHSSSLAWRIPWTEEPGELQSMGHKEPDMTDMHSYCWMVHVFPVFAMTNAVAINIHVHFPLVISGDLIP